MQQLWTASQSFFAWVGGGLRGEHGQAVYACQCQGHWVRQGHCGYHYGSLVGASGPWCRTKHDCGQASFCGSWVLCDEGTVERRRGDDGKLYTAKEFRSYYGTYYGKQKWVDAARYTETRIMRPGGRAYDVHEFRGLHIDIFGEAGWFREWSAANPERRRADDGQLYFLEEFQKHYGLPASWAKWRRAKEDACTTDVDRIQKYGTDPGVEANMSLGLAGVTLPVAASNVTRLFMLEASKHPRARCLDGSMAGYYFRGGPEAKYLVFFEGGGWCYDQDCRAPTQEGTLQDCRTRSKGRLGSSKWWPTEQDPSYLTGMLSSDPRTNPVFHNWTLVYLPYCDGASFSGAAIVQGLHFQGQAIWKAVLEDVRLSMQIQEAEQVVVSGGSAGASAVYFHVDEVADQLKLRGGEVLALPDAGFFLDMRRRDGVDCWPAQMRSLFEVANGYGSLNQRCLASFPRARWKCLFPEYFVGMLDSRTLVLNSLYDSSELTYTLGLECCPGPGPLPCGRQPPCDRGAMALFEALRAGHARALAAISGRAGSGAWAPACVGHTLAWRRWSDLAWAVPSGSKHTMSAVVRRWLLADGGNRSFGFIDRVAWPDNTPCAGAW